MSHFRGFKLAKRIRTLACRICRRRPRGFRRLEPPDRVTCPSTISKLRSWGHRLKDRARAALCSASSKPRLRLGTDPGRVGYLPVKGVEAEKMPKGHLAVYVGQKDGEYRRVLVPVMYFNHPLFGELLREAEEEYGFHHPGGITIPCRISDFESVQTRIAAIRDCGGRWLTPKRRPF